MLVAKQGDALPRRPCEAAQATSSQALNEGALASNPLRQAKNTFIGLATMVGKVGAIEGGMDEEEAYQLIDLYVQECEKTNSVELVKTLQYNLLLDFCDRVARHRLPPGLSPEVAEATRFVVSRVNDRIDVDDVADHIGRSRSYTTRRFRAETGRSVNFFITQSKVAAAQSLLLHTNMSIAQISEHLCFSSQAYFQNVFKRWCGATPKQWRDEQRAETQPDFTRV